MSRVRWSQTLVLLRGIRHGPNLREAHVSRYPLVALQYNIPSAWQAPIAGAGDIDVEHAIPSARD
jgi:hypothetical protein